MPTRRVGDRRSGRRSLMMIGFPSEIFRERFLDSGGDMRGVDGDMMLVTVLANIGEQLLKIGNAANAVAAKRREWVIRQIAFADVSAYFARGVVGADAEVGERGGFDPANHGAVGVFLADRASNDFLKIHHRFARPFVDENVFGEIAAMEDTPLSGSSP